MRSDWEYGSTRPLRQDQGRFFDGLRPGSSGRFYGWPRPEHGRVGDAAYIEDGREPGEGRGKWHATDVRSTGKQRPLKTELAI